MSVARNTEISATSEKLRGRHRAGHFPRQKTLRNVKGAWIKEQQIDVEGDGGISEYRVNMIVTFILDDASAVVAARWRERLVEQDRGGR